MKARLVPFNIYFLLLLSLGLSGCGTLGGGKNKEATVMRFHLEVATSYTSKDMAVSIYRNEPVLINIANEPFLTEGDVEMAAVAPAPGGFSLKIQFNQRGTWILEAITTEHKGKRIVVYSHFGGEKGDARWLAAPMIRRQISDGMLVFTPDASYEESQRIVRGVNNVSKALKKRSL